MRDRMQWSCTRTQKLGHNVLHVHVHHMHKYTSLIVCNNYNYLNKLSSKGGIAISSVSQMVKATGLSQAMFVQIIHEETISKW